MDFLIKKNNHQFSLKKNITIHKLDEMKSYIFKLKPTVQTLYFTYIMLLLTGSELNPV
jgi:hypothetical protein